MMRICEEDELAKTCQKIWKYEAMAWWLGQLHGGAMAQ